MPKPKTFRKSHEKVVVATKRLLTVLDDEFTDHGEATIRDIDEIEGAIAGRRIDYSTRLEEAKRLEAIETELEELSALSKKAVKNFSKAVRIYMFGGPRHTEKQIAKTKRKQEYALKKMIGIVLKQHDEDITDYLRPIPLEVMQSLTRRMLSSKNRMNQKLLFNSLTTFVNLILANKDPKAIGTPGQWTDTLRLLSVIAVSPSYKSELSKRDARNALFLQREITKRISPTQAVLTLQELLAPSKATVEVKTAETPKPTEAAIIEPPSTKVAETVIPAKRSVATDAAEPPAIVQETPVLEKTPQDEAKTQDIDASVIPKTSLEESHETVTAHPEVQTLGQRVKKAAVQTTAARKPPKPIARPPRTKGNPGESEEGNLGDDDEVIVRMIKPKPDPSLEAVKDEILTPQKVLAGECEEALKMSKQYLYGTDVFGQPPNQNLKNSPLLLGELKKRFSIIEQMVRDDPKALHPNVFKELSRLLLSKNQLLLKAAESLITNLKAAQASLG